MSLSTPAPSEDTHRSVASVNINKDYSYGDNTNDHLINGYCYKAFFHETILNNAKDERERENTMLFLPGKNTKLHFIKGLILRRYSYPSNRWDFLS